MHFSTITFFALINCIGTDYSLFCAFCNRFGANLTPKFKKNYASYAPSSGAIWQEFAEKPYEINSFLSGNSM